MINRHHKKIIKMVQTLLESERRTNEITTEKIIEKIELILPLNPDWLGADRSYLIDELVRRNSVSSGVFHKLGDNTNHVKWYGKNEKLERRYWERYRAYLEESLPWSAIEAIDEVTDSVMSDIESPQREGLWDRRGLVVGHVQSGKTSNYTGLICKAADAGYKIIIVLAGLHNNLRAQTQARLDEGFLGYETNPDSKNPDLRTMRRIGVGEIDKDPKLRPQYVTTRLESGDFKASIAQNLGVTPEERPWLFVIKKQKTVLTSLLKWLKEHVADSVDTNTGEKYISTLPLLMIDDEADNASVDTGEQEMDGDGNLDPLHNPKTINSLIRQILKLFHKKAYIGYTATPFANIFIHEKGETLKEGPDLFPSAFIYNIPAPSNYIGPKKVFGVASEDDRINTLPLIVAVDDHVDREGKKGWMPSKHNKHHLPTYPNEENLPPSLKDAIDSYILACAARNVRGMSDKHSSMLIHVTRLQAVQNEIKALVSNYIRKLKQRMIRGLDTEALVERWRKKWENDFIRKTSVINETKIFAPLPLIDWSSVLHEIPIIIEEIEVKAVNGSAKDALDYVDAIEPQRIIAIGGDKLARGLTLEGLVTSYFLRASKMYDTLMQMGRWFGYRDGYIDLCRLYTTADLIEWFEHITDAAEELRGEFDYMEQTGSSPREYGLRVKSHPTLLVTSPLKMRNGRKMQLSFSGELVETVSFSTNAGIVQSNMNAVIQLMESAGDGDRAPDLDGDKWNGYRWNGVSSELIIDFLNNYTTHEHSYKVNTDLLTRFVQGMNGVGELREWNIALLNGSSDQMEIINGTEIYPVMRSSRNSGRGRFSIGRLVSPKDEAIDLSLAEWKTVKQASKKGINNLAIRRVKAQHRGNSAEGLLMIYLVRPKPPINYEHSFEQPFVGVALSFPSSEAGVKATYIVNKVGQDDYL